MNTKSYLLELDYGDRLSTRPFLHDLLDRFSHESLTGITFFVNNNPYNLEFLLLLVFEDDDEKFDSWIRVRYPEMEFRFLFNYPLDDIVNGQLNNKRYNSYSFNSKEQVDNFLIEEHSKVFLFSPRKVLNDRLGGQGYNRDNYRVFLSHSSLDKPLIDRIFLELQKSDVSVWYDKYEIDYGEGITEKINQGLKKCGLGLLCVSYNFLESNWARREMNYFLQKQINSGENNLLCINMNVPHEKLPPLIQDPLYLEIGDEKLMEKLVRAIRKKAEFNYI